MITWVQRYRGLSFVDACRFLGGEPLPGRPYPSEEHPVTDPAAIPPGPDWQQAVWNVVNQAAVNLWNPVGVQALAYLKRRDLSRDTIAQAKLGFVHGHSWEWQTIGHVNVPCGITIPWFIGKELWAVKVRRSAGAPKYVQIAGGSASGLYNLTRMEGHTTVLFVEGEFDALLAQQKAAGLGEVVTLGSASVTLNPFWLSDLVTYRTIWLLMIPMKRDAKARHGSRR